MTEEFRAWFQVWLDLEPITMAGGMQASDWFSLSHIRPKGAGNRVSTTVQRKGVRVRTAEENHRCSYVKIGANACSYDPNQAMFPVVVP